MLYIILQFTSCLKPEIKTTEAATEEDEAAEHHDITTYITSTEDIAIAIADDSNNQAMLQESLLNEDEDEDEDQEATKSLSFKDRFLQFFGCKRCCRKNRKSATP